MRPSVRGLEGAQSRVSELQAKLESLRAKKSGPSFEHGALANNPQQFDATLSGLISQGQGNEALDPIAAGLLKAPGGGTPDPRILQMARATAEKYGIDPKLFESLIHQESNFNPTAQSSAGAQGLTQLMPKTAASLGVTDPFDPMQNLNGGAKYLSQLLKQFDGDTKLALAAYNAGPGAVRRAGGIPPFQETQDYVRKVLDRFNGGG